MQHLYHPTWNSTKTMSWTVKQNFTICNCNWKINVLRLRVSSNISYLGSNSVWTSREKLSNASSVESMLWEPYCCSQSGTTSSYNHCIVCMVNHGVWGPPRSLPRRKRKYCYQLSSHQHLKKEKQKKKLSQTAILSRVRVESITLGIEK